MLTILHGGNGLGAGYPPWADTPCARRYLPKADTRRFLGAVLSAWSLAVWLRKFSVHPNRRNWTWERRFLSFKLQDDSSRVVRDWCFCVFYAFNAFHGWIYLNSRHIWNIKNPVYPGNHPYKILLCAYLDEYLFHLCIYSVRLLYRTCKIVPDYHRTMWFRKV